MGCVQCTIAALAVGGVWLTRRDTMLPPYERVLRRTERNGDCIEFMGARNARNYGTVRVDRKSWLAHRVVAAEIHGLAAIEGMAVCHTCDNPPCVNPDHLFIGTLSDNAFDRERKGRGRDIRGAKNPRHNRKGVSCTL